MDYAAAYTEMHEANPKQFSGNSIKAHVPAIADMVRSSEARTLLDYGSGKGYQYLSRRVHEAWGGILPTCYDVGVRQISRRPEGTFDGVICTDVMEHVAPADVDRILADVLGFADKFAFFAIACRKAKKRLPDGRNAHLTVKEPAFWDARLAAHARPGLTVRVSYDTAPDPE